MSNIATSINQSKQLQSLGLSADTADMNYCNSSYKGKDYIGEWKLSLQSPQEAKSILDMSATSWNTYWEIIPAWSLSRLLELMPYNISDNKAVYNFKLEKKVNSWWCYHENFGSSSTPIVKRDNPIDAAFEMMCYLLENKLIK